MDTLSRMESWTGVNTALHSVENSIKKLAAVPGKKYQNTGLL